MALIKTYQSTSYIGKDESAPIYVSFYLNREKVVIPCKTNAKVINFDKDAGKIKRSEKGYTDKNLLIEKIRSRVNDILVRYRLMNKKLSKESFMKAYNRPDDFNTFFDFVENYQRTHDYEIELSTLDVHIDVMNKLKRYSPTLHFDDISEDFILKYKGHMRKSLKNAESTAMKNLATIKKYIRAAVRLGYMENNPFENIKIKRNLKSNFCYLSEAELKDIISYYNENELTEAKNIQLQFFLFLCFSSLHVSDAKKLTIDQIGEKNLTYFRIKNRNSKPEAIVVPLSKPAKTILKKAIGKRKVGKVFENLFADQKINEFLKTVADRLYINKSLSTKTGRHTFATLFLSKTKDINTLKNIMGHTDIRETLVYAHVMEESKLEGIKTFNIFTI